VVLHGCRHAAGALLGYPRGSRLCRFVETLQDLCVTLPLDTEPEQKFRRGLVVLQFVGLTLVGVHWDSGR
jgi:hypothetical protein